VEIAEEGDRFLPRDIGRTDDVPYSLPCGIGPVEVFENRLEGAAVAAMIQRHFRESRRIERGRVFALRRRAIHSPVPE